MGRSVVLLGTKDGKTDGLQMRRVMEQFGARATSTEGPFSDRKGNVEQIAELARSVVRLRIHDRVSATVIALSPQNQPGRPESWLRKPFILIQNGQKRKMPVENAGEIAALDPIADRSCVDGKGIPVDIEELTLMTVAVLRRLGVESFYAQALFEGKKEEGSENITSKITQPVVLLGGERPRAINLSPLQMSDEPLRTPLISLEVLDSEALAALIGLKNAAAQTEALLADVLAKRSVFSGEWKLRASLIGHNIHESVGKWSLADAGKSICDIVNILRPNPPPPFLSVREVADQMYTHRLLCMNCQLAMAINASGTATAMMLPPHFQEGPSDYPDEKMVERILQEIIGSGAEDTLLGIQQYLSLALTMKGHVHNVADCSERTSVQ